MADRVAVIGGGVIGALRTTSPGPGSASRSWTRRFGAACSHANCGFICPSHVLPLAGAGAIWSTLKTLFHRIHRSRCGRAWRSATWAGFSALPAL